MSIYSKRKTKNSIKTIRSYELGGGGAYNHGKRMKAKAKGKRNFKRAQ